MDDNTLDKKLIEHLASDRIHFYTESLNEDMSIVHESIGGWWKPRYLLDHLKEVAHEFLDKNEYLANFKINDVEWHTLQGIPKAAYSRAQRGYAGFPIHIGNYEDGIAKVSWQINPDGQYYRDEDGYGMTDDEAITLIGYVDRSGRIVKKYRLSTV